MKISEMIKALCDAQVAHGDMDVQLSFRNDDGSAHSSHNVFLYVPFIKFSDEEPKHILEIMNYQY